MILSFDPAVALAWAAVAAYALSALGDFKADPLNVSALGRNQPAAQKLYDRAGWR